jgi:rubrerythrin
MEALDFAIKMELDGERYYYKQAELHHEEGLKAVFTMLAKEENGHAGLLKSISKGSPYSLSDPLRPELKNVFKGKPNVKSDIKETPDPVDAYRAALEMEKKSIDLYTKLLSENGSGKGLFAFLVKQEKEHYRIIDVIIKMVNRPNDWVEAAEFGIREDY